MPRGADDERIAALVGLDDGQLAIAGFHRCAGAQLEPGDDCGAIIPNGEGWYVPWGTRHLCRACRDRRLAAADAEREHGGVGETIIE